MPKTLLLIAVFSAACDDSELPSTPSGAMKTASKTTNEVGQEVKFTCGQGTQFQPPPEPLTTPLPASKCNKYGCKILGTGL